jgi:hypothetical protein
VLGSGCRDDGPVRRALQAPRQLHAGGPDKDGDEALSEKDLFKQKARGPTDYFKGEEAHDDVFYGRHINIKKEKTERKNGAG